MVNKLIHLSIKHRFIMLFIGCLLLAWGAYSFSQLPIEAYPDVMNTQVVVITQWGVWVVVVACGGGRGR